jgi:membrane associated rhomboid family serine protease
MLLPISDDDRGLLGPAYVTIALLVANVLVFVLLQQFGSNEEFTFGYSVIPSEITTGTDLTTARSIVVQGQQVVLPHAPGPVPIYLTVLSAMFMHGGLMHLLGNLLYLWIFGDNIEHRFGSWVFLLFYLASGVAATAAQVMLDPSSIIPNLGASGAISGVLGGYLVLFPRNRVNAIFLYFVVSVPAVLALGMWIIFQLVESFALVGVGQVGGVAYGAHIGGFVTGAVLALFLRRLITERENVVSRGGAGARTRRVW